MMYWFELWLLWLRAYRPKPQLVYMEFSEGEMIYVKPIAHRCSA